MEVSRPIRSKAAASTPRSLLGLFSSQLIGPEVCGGIRIMDTCALAGPWRMPDNDL